MKFRLKTPETLRKICKDLFFWFPEVEISRKKIFEDLFRLKKVFEDLFFFGEQLRLCPWPREGLSLALKFFCVLGLESSTPPLTLLQCCSLLILPLHQIVKFNYSKTGSFTKNIVAHKHLGP